VALGVDADFDARPPASAEDIARAEALDGECMEQLRAGNYAEATAAAEQAIRACPTWLTPYHNLGVVHHLDGQLASAAELFRICIALYPYYDPAHDNLAETLLRLGDREGALDASLAMEAMVPGSPDNRFRIATLYLRSGRYGEATTWLDRGLNTQIPQKLTRMLPYGVVTAPRLLHDLQQLQYLQSRHVLGPSFDSVRAAYRKHYDEAYKPEDGDWTRPEVDGQLPPSQLSMLVPFYRRALHLAQAPALAGGALNAALPWKAIVSRYEAHAPFEYAVIDDLLRPEALDTLYRYLQESTIWHNDAQKGRNYLGGYRNMGMHCPLVEQIITEAKQALSDILASHELGEIWAYRHITGGKAIGAHADFSSVNLNLWVTPDSANLVPGTGGLILYKRLSPDDWRFADYNDARERIATVIRDAERVVIPYRQNRAILFNAGLFHESDAIHFATDEYVNHRINVTLLFGQGRAV
jgi:tetratricopeptide (TPR) repeat protein